MSKFRRFCAEAVIPSRDEGMIRLTSFLGTQEYLDAQINAGLADGIHDFVVLKGGRQIGGSTYLDMRIPYHLQVHRGMVGLMVSDDEPNRDYRRDVILEMLSTLPEEWRWPVRLSNKNVLAWDQPNQSRLLFDYAGVREGSNLGRSRGVNVGYNDEVGSWNDQKAVSALRASYSKAHVKRLYVSISTARGDNVFKAMWTAAQTATATRAVFLPWWRRTDFAVLRGTPQWEKYHGEPSRDEWHWMDMVQRRYDVEIIPGQLFWHRWMLAEEFYGDETMMAQEYGCLPEECFQAFGAKFIAQHVVRRLRDELTLAPAPKGHRFEWAPMLEDSTARPADPDDAKTPLRVWREPSDTDAGVYVLGAHPWGSSRPDAALNVIEVFRAWPDRMEQVAEFATPHGNVHEFAWTLAYLAGVFKHPRLASYLNLEIGGDGVAVLDELQRMERFGYGLSQRGRSDMQDILGAVNHLFHRRPDSLRQHAVLDTRGTPSERITIMGKLRSEVERGHLILRSPQLIDELSMLRRGEGGDADQISGGGRSSDARAYATALAVESWLQEAMHDRAFTMVVPPAGPPEEKHVSQFMVENFMRIVARGGRPR